MNSKNRRCPLTYVIVNPETDYSHEGLKSISPRLKHLYPLKLSSAELLIEATRRAAKLSIQGVQPKLSATLSVSKGCFNVVDQFGRWILKPPTPQYPQMPENEDLSMHLASLVGIRVPRHGLVYNSDKTFTYFIQRFDRMPKGRKKQVEDMAQLAGKTRETKYRYSMEGIIKLINRYCTFPEIEKKELFLRTLFNYLIGNEDMHLKNFSIILNDDVYQLSPAYDLLNTSIAIGLNNVKEELALTLGGKKSNFKKNDFMIYLASEQLGLNSSTINEVLNTISATLPAFKEWINNSFLSKMLKADYLLLLNSRTKTLSLQ